MLCVLCNTASLDNLHRCDNCQVYPADVLAAPIGQRQYIVRLLLAWQRRLRQQDNIDCPDIARALATWQRALAGEFDHLINATSNACLRHYPAQFVKTMEQN